jgi:Zn finger protein HypA/HybF involved in hydrogenase expression
MERFPRGTLPPSQFSAAIIERRGGTEDDARCVPHDLDTVCPQCQTQMRPEHAHYRCPACGYRDSCCF